MMMNDDDENWFFHGFFNLCIKVGLKLHGMISELLLLFDLCYQTLTLIYSVLMHC